MNTNFQITFDTRKDKVYEISPVNTFKSLKDDVYKTFSINAGDFYLIDNDGIYHPIDSEKEFSNSMSLIKRGVKIYVDQNTEGNDNTAVMKCDTRNLKMNNEFTDIRNDKKTRNFLVKKKIERSILKKNIGELNGSKTCYKKCQCEKCKQVRTLYTCLEEYKSYFEGVRDQKKMNRKCKKFTGIAQIAD
jgi:hypothetical protein